ncbi:MULTISPECIES: hypothetical protein [Arthrobacter]|uniref:DUF2238 domain-containing protein n=1 Tax=Arthrobacter psychrochitiniphilus TaxID=291045 RepID=A0A2V3DUU5_9MICC|nr:MULTISPECIES: hypothetical protein [Arthrobacter]NYG18537.1 hypothetical protein [Arthrobacter psychrochitiniphilus]PXA64348.1 hypothetical protein CVS29_15530 [Arthrobacter psychrochitiniphilus]
MIENFLRRPHGAMDFVAEALRFVAVLSVVVTAIFFEPSDAGIIAFALPGFVAPRFLGMRAGMDMVFVATLLIAAWSNIFDLYTSIGWWDLVVHLAGNGVIAAGLYLLLARGKVVPDPRGTTFTKGSGIVLTAMMGLALSALWEMVEWFGRAFISDQIFIAYDDTIGDIAMGGLGSLAAGFVVAFIPLLRKDAT